MLLKGNNSLNNKLERATHIDFNRDGRIGGYPTPFPNHPHHQRVPYSSPYGTHSGLPLSPNIHPSGGANSGLINELEKATNIDLNGDGRIGAQSNYPPYFPPYNPYSAPPPGAGLMNELEKATHMDLNGDGRIGGQPAYPHNFQQPSGSLYPPPPPPSFQPPGSGLVNELERATNIDLNGDGRIGGQPPFPPNFQQPNAPFYPPPPPPNYQPPGGGFVNELERATNIDLNGDGRIGGQPPFPPNFQQPNAPFYPPLPPPNFQPPGGGFVNELERATNIDLNGDGRIGGQPAYPHNFQQPNAPFYPPPPPPPPNFQPPGSGLLNELERATNIDLNGDGRIGGQPSYSAGYNPYGYRH